MIPPILRENRAFRTYFAGQAISLLGDQVSLIALPLVGVLVLHATPAEMGYLTTAALVPNLLFSLHAGAWVDKRGRRRQTMIAADLARSALLATIPIVYAFDALTFAQLYAVGFLVGAASVLFNVSSTTLFVSLVPRERYVEANSLSNGSRAASFVGGPSLGGAARPGFLGARSRSSSTRCPSSARRFRSARISPVEPEVGTAERGHLTAGLRYVLGSPIVRPSLFATTTINFFNFVFFALFVLFAIRYLHVSPGVLGVVLGAGAVGGLLGAFLTGRIVAPDRVGPAFMLGCVAFPVPLAARPARGRAAVGRPRLPVPRRVRLRLRRDAARHQLRLDQRRARPAALRSRVSGAFNVVNYGVRPIGAFARRPARERDRRPRDALDRQ